ncbi:MAG: SDR family oxidoreductase, partial [Chloroflexi bacterium]|nr:SDR family oxidoreductase [Chloroflexota bacterium]
QTRQGGRIVYFTSAAGIRGAAGQPNYSAAHAGKIGLMRSTAKGLARYGVTANCISPNAATRMTDRGLDQAARIARGEPLPSTMAAGKPDDPKNVVPVIVYLCSDQGANVNGRVFGMTGHQVALWADEEWDQTIYWPEPLWDIDKLYEYFPVSLGIEGFPEPPMQT